MSHKDTLSRKQQPRLVSIGWDRHEVRQASQRRGDPNA
jgi:hypothetical protein